MKRHSGVERESVWARVATRWGKVPLFEPEGLEVVGGDGDRVLGWRELVVSLGWGFEGMSSGCPLCCEALFFLRFFIPPASLASLGQRPWSLKCWTAQRAAWRRAAFLEEWRVDLEPKSWPDMVTTQVYCVPELKSV